MTTIDRQYAQATGRYWLEQAWTRTLAGALVGALLAASAATHAATHTETVTGTSSCPSLALGTELSLAQIINRALCANPETQAAWQRTRTQTAQIGIARSAYFPDLTLSAQQRRNLTDNAPLYPRQINQISLNSHWLLWDFGGRSANVQETETTLAALQASASAASQQVALQAVEAYFDSLAYAASLEAADLSVQAAEETARAARQRTRLGAGTREDELQADTALAEAELKRIQARGDLANAEGQLAVVAGYPANQTLTLQGSAIDPAQSPPPPELATLLEQARKRRAEGMAQSYRIAAAESDLDRIAAQSRPRISLDASSGRRLGSDGSKAQGEFVLSATLPLFTGFLQRHQTLAAQSRISQERIELSHIEARISLDVWQAWQLLSTARARIQASDSLLDSATQSRSAALARYRAGLGSILNVLSAQNSLANARGQQARARYQWASARLRLAQASGLLLDDTNTMSTRNPSS